MLSSETILQNRYRIIRQLGQGGMGAVYEALDQRLDTTVALKETLFADERLRKQFEREARLLARLHHQALPRVSDHFNEGDGQFLVMQFIAGDDLQDMLTRRNRPFPQAEVMVWADQLCDALDYLHTQDPQIIHRDIKPQNLKLTSRGQIILLDFGLAKGSAGQMSVVTTSASIFGYTPNYAPLEQVQGLGTDERSDIYSLAATLYHLLTNVKPPDALSRAGALVNGQPDPLQPAHRVAPQVTRAVASVLNRGMAQKRNDRYPSASEMGAALRAAAKSPAEFAEAETVLATGALASPDAKTAAGELPTRLVAEAKTIGAGSEAKTLLATNAGTVRGATPPGETTIVRPGQPAQRSRAWLGAAALIVLIAGGAGGYYAYRSRHGATLSQTEQAKPPVATQSVEPNLIDLQSTPTKSSTENSSTTNTETKNDTAAANPSRSNTAKQKSEKGSTKATTGDVAGDPTRNRATSPVTELPAQPQDPYANQPYPNGRRPPPDAAPRVRTLPNGTRMVTQPDGTRILTFPDGRTRIFPPGTKPNRRRNGLPY